MFDRNYYMTILMLFVASNAVMPSAAKMLIPVSLKAFQQHNLKVCRPYTMKPVERLKRHNEVRCLHKNNHHNDTADTMTNGNHITPKSTLRWFRSILKKDENRNCVPDKDSVPGIVLSVDVPDDTSPNWVDRTMTRIVAAITYVAVGRSMLNLWVENQSDIATELANKLFSKESIEVVKTVQSILSNVHTEHGVVDVFGKYRTMDVLAAIVALSRLQRIVITQERTTEMEQFKIRETNGQNNHGIDLQLVQDLAHYAKYAHAAYGWTLDLALRWKVHFRGNNQALVRMTGIDWNDIVKAEWTARAPHQPAYFIVRDHAHRTIVLCIRGTWSVNDMLTNLYCTSTSKDYFRQILHRQLSCHSGMLEAAKAVHGDTIATISQELSNNPDYNLVLVGHSLGGGCAALLGKLFEDRYPKLKVYLYGAPCVVPENNAINNKNVVSVIVKGDPFSCLSLGHVADVSTGIEYLCKNDELRNEVLLRTNSVMSIENQHDDETNMAWCSATMNLLRKRMSAEKLYPPGRILLLRKELSVVQKSFGNIRLRWRWHFRRNEASLTLHEVPIHYFRDLLISANMFNLSKHLPSMYVSKLNDLASKMEIF